MCAILDKNVVGQVFGSQAPPAGKGFLNWLNSGNGLLVVGGELRRELNESSNFKEWLQQATLAGLVRLYNDDKVNDRAEELKNADSCRSDDPHIVALAQVSGARLLFTNDDDLKKDFTDKKLINDPPGKVYTTLHDERQGRKYVKVRREDFRENHKRLLGNKSLCKRK